MNTKTKTHLLALALLLAPLTQLQAQGRTAQFALTGDAAPDGNGFLGTGFSAPVLNNNGDVLFRDLALTGTAGGGADNAGLFRASATTLLQVMREGQAAPDGNGVLSASIGINALNDSGQAAFWNSLTGTAGGSADDEGIYRGSGGALEQVARAGQAAPLNGTFNFFSSTSTAINADGRVAFLALLTGTPGGTTDDTALYRDNAGTTTLTQMAREGQGAPDGNGALGSLGSPLINASGNVAFFANLTGTAGGAADNSGVFISSNGSLAQVAREGDAAPGGNGVLGSFNSPTVLTDAGQVVFRNFLTGTSGGGSDNEMILRGDAGGLARIVREGQAAPGGIGEFSTFNTALNMNANGTVAFLAGLRNTGGSLNDTGIYRGAGSTPVEIAREGDAAPDGNGELASFASPAINDSGAAAFRVFFRNTAAGSTDDTAIVLADGIDTVQVVREGDALAGSTVTFADFDAISAPYGDGLNNFGQVAYLAVLANGNWGIFVFTPELHWRSNFSSSWDSASFSNPGGLNNWTLSLRPGEVHDTFVDPDNDVFVTGPAGAETVKSLTIGGGFGIATLNLNGGSIAALEGVQITGNGVLTGTGAIVGTVTNTGEVIADNVTISGGSLINNGRVTGTTADNNRINAQLLNQAGGEVRVATGQSARFTAAGNTNAGRIEAFGGEIEFGQDLTNLSGGDIIARNATLRFNGGLNNQGSFNMSFGTSDVLGDISNTGIVTQSGAGQVSFYDDFTNNGTVQVSTGSTAVFFGTVSGSGAFTGTGTVFFEGLVLPGTSPGKVSVEGDLNLGIGAHTLMEIGGLVRGDEYDAFDIGSSLNILGGELEVSLFDTGGGLFTPKLGDSFDLFSAESISGDFDVLTLAVLGGGLGWQLDFLTDAIGTLDVARLSVVASAVPVPGAVWLFGSGLLGLIGIARRERVTASGDS